jgi:prepilin-type N-terminal cleavage/methylation domain-containing protein
MGRSNGFTLIEAIVAIVVLSVAIPPMLLAMRETQHRRVAPIQADRARWLASERLEEIIADRHSTTRGWAYLVNANYAAETPVNGFQGFGRSVAITETGADLASAGTGYKKIAVTVTWADAGVGAGASRSFTLSTVVTDYTP